MSHLTPIGSRLLLSLDDEYLRMQNEWFFKWHLIRREKGVEIDSFFGKPIFLGGSKEFSGSDHKVYWDAIQRYLRKKVGSVFDALEEDLKKYVLEVRAEALTEANWIVNQFAAKIRRVAIEKDRILRGNGIEFPLERDFGPWEGGRLEDIDARVEKLRQIYCDPNRNFAEMEGRLPQNITANFHGPNSRLNVNSTDSSINVASGVSGEQLAGFIHQVRTNMAGLPGAQQKAIAEPLAVLEAEAASPTPSQSKIHSSLQTIKTVIEGAAGNLVASGIGTLIGRMLGGG